MRKTISLHIPFVVFLLLYTIYATIDEVCIVCIFIFIQIRGRIIILGLMKQDIFNLPLALTIRYDLLDVFGYVSWKSLKHFRFYWYQLEKYFLQCSGQRDAINPWSIQSSTIRNRNKWDSWAWSFYTGSAR